MWVSVRKPIQAINDRDWPFLGVRHFGEEAKTSFAAKKKKVKFYDSSWYYGLEKCIKTRDLVKGNIIYYWIVVYGYESDTFLGSHLVRLLVICNNVIEANYVFSKLECPNLYAWSEIILANSKHGQSEKALHLFGELQKTALKLDKFVLVPALKACACLGVVLHGQLIHSHIVEDGLETNDFIRSALIDMYVKCTCIQDARSVFGYACNDDVVIWNVMVAGYSMNGYLLDAFELIRHMQLRGPTPNEQTWTSLLTGFARHGQSEVAVQVFEQMLSEGVEPDVVAWNAIISGYALDGCGHQALFFLHFMMKEGEDPNRITLLSGLKACASILDLSSGKFIHDFLMNAGLESCLALSTSLINMYAKCGSLDDAQILFDRLQSRDTAVWNALISGYNLHGHGVMTLKLFQQMQKEGITPNSTTLLTILKMTALTLALNKGKLIHAIMIECNVDTHELAGSSLIDMYARCGSLMDACNVLQGLPQADSVSWNALLGGFALYADYCVVHQQFEDMQAAGLVPDEITFVSLLSSCSYLGLVREGSKLFNIMREKYEIVASNEHYGCMVDLLGRAGLLLEVEDLLYTMPFRPSMVPWTSLLNNCRIYNNPGLAEQCFEEVVAIDPACASSYALMSQIYTVAGLAEDSEKLVSLREQSNTWKKPGKTYIEVGCDVLEFVVGDVSQSLSEDIYAKVEHLNTHLRLGGHVCGM